MPTTELPLSPFSQLQLCVHGDVEIDPSLGPKMVIDGEPNAVDLRMAGPKLIISSHHRMRWMRAGRLHLRVGVGHLERLELYCHGTVRSTGPIVGDEAITLRVFSHGDVSLDLRTPTLDVTMATHGNVGLEGECFEATISSASHGNLDTRYLKAVNLSIRNASHGDLCLYAGHSLRVRNMGHGNIDYCGPVRSEDVVHWGHGRVRRAS